MIALSLAAAQSLCFFIRAVFTKMFQAFFFLKAKNKTSCRAVCFVLQHISFFINKVFVRESKFSLKKVILSPVLFLFGMFDVSQ